MARDFVPSAYFLSAINEHALNASNPVTVGAWVYPDTVAAGDRVICSWWTSSATAGWAFLIPGDELRFIRRGNTPVTSTAMNLTASTWQFVGTRVVTNGANSDIKMIKYSTAFAKTTQNLSDNFNSYSGANQMMIGAVDTGTGGSFDGRMAHLGVWIGSELTDAEMLAYAMYGPNAVGRPISFYCPIWGLATDEYSIEIGQGELLTKTGTANQIDLGAPIAPYAPIFTHAGAA